MTRTVFDTNVYISGLVFGGVPGTLLAHAAAGGFEICVSPRIQPEVIKTLREKMGWSEERIRTSCKPLWEIACHVRPTLHLALADDPDDDHILECAGRRRHRARDGR